MARVSVGIRDVAREAGVSVTTVSHVLNEHPHARVRPETRDKVRNVAERLGYRPNRLAQGLRTQSSGMIGLLTEEIATTPHAGRIILGAQEAASRNNLTLVIINSPLLADADARRDDVRELLDRRVDALLYATVYHDVVSPPAELLTVPSVLIGAVDRTEGIRSVVPDEAGGAAQAVASLVERGHRRIAFIGNVEDVPATRGRHAGYETALAAANIARDSTLLAFGESEARGGYQAATDLLQGGARPTAIFCYNDRMAIGVYRAVTQRGLRVPDDVSVIGFDNQAPIPESLFPQLTTIGLPHYEMGAWAVESLVANLGGDPMPASARLPCQLIERESVAHVERQAQD